MNACAIGFSAVVLGLVASAQDSAPPNAHRYFAIEVVDEQTGRGVPMVELQTTSSARYYTDSAGLIAFDEPGLMGNKVFFTVSAHGYEFKPDGFGIRGVMLVPQPGGHAQLKIKRINVAERLYRITGQGIYRDSVLLGRTPPIAEPLLNAQVTGQDSVQNAIYRGKLYWFYGDTNRLSYALGNFKMSGATSELPEKIDPSIGLNLGYFVGDDGFSRPMAAIDGEGVVWLFGITVVPDDSGRERMVSYFQRRRGLEAVLESGFAMFNDDRNTFEKIQSVPNETLVHPTGFPFRVRSDDGIDYLYCTAPYPSLRMKANLKSYFDLGSYEAYTCLKPGTRSANPNASDLERDARGKLVWEWKKDTPPLALKAQHDLIAAGKMTREETPFRLHDADGGKPVLLNNASCFWNNYRKKYILIASEMFGATMLGEVWYSEANRPEGPWTHARKIITHANKPGDAHDFYNPKQHPFFDRHDGQVIYIEGTYVNTFSGNPHPTPYYEYNQIMYRLDLSDARLRFPE